MSAQKEKREFQSIIHEKYFSSDIFRYVSHIIISIAVGMCAGTGAVLFHFLLEKMRHFFGPESFPTTFNAPPYMFFLVPVCGGIVIIAITLAFRSIARERGVLSVIKSMIFNNGYIPFKVTLFHFFAPILSIGTGAPLGPEGPAAQLGSGIGSMFSQYFKFDKKDVKMYTVAGAAAAISAVFNAPITGVFFGIEVILLNDLKNQALSALIISSVVADVISRAVLGTSSIFQIPDYTPIAITDYPLYLILGIACGLVSLIYFIIKKQAVNIVQNKLHITNKFLIILPLTLVFGLLTIKYNHLFGIGYEAVNDVINGNLGIETVSTLFVLRLIFLALFLAAGFYGGTFAPSILLGVLLGFSFASGINSITGWGLDTTAFALVGMGGVLAGINSIPLTSILLVFESTNDYKFILPLMLVSIISYLVTLYFNKGTVYTNKLLELGIDISKKGEVDLLGKIKVKDLMRKKFGKVSYDLSFKKLSSIILNSPTGDVVVMDKKERMIGIVSLNDIRHAIQENEVVDILIAADLATKVPVITDEETVSSALNLIKQYDLENVPVVKKESKKTPAGILVQRDITQAYDRLLEEWETDQFLIDYDKKRKPKEA